MNSEGQRAEPKWQEHKDVGIEGLEIEQAWRGHLRGIRGEADLRAEPMATGAAE